MKPAKSIQSAAASRDARRLRVHPLVAVLAGFGMGPRLKVSARRLDERSR
ncbi:MAG: hypothetical protein ABL982_00020 [Vicinamibacterales bacterium]